MKKLISVFLSAILILLLLAACDSGAASGSHETTADTQDVEETTTEALDEAESEPIQYKVEEMYGTYSRTNDDKYSSAFDFTLSIYPDGRYYYYEGFGGHIAYGNYTVEGNVISITDETIPHIDGKIFCFKFEYCGDKLVFLANESDQFMYVDDLPDKAIFNRAPEAEQ